MRGRRRARDPAAAMPGVARPTCRLSEPHAFDLEPATSREADEIRPVNSRLLAEVLRQIGTVTRNDEVLRASGLTHEQAVLEIDSLIWEGLHK